MRDNMDDKETLARILELTEDTNKMTRKMRRAQKLANFWSIIYWIIIVSLSIGAFYYIQPFIDGFIHAYQSVVGTDSNSTSTAFNLGDAVRKLVK